jgi:hypothetical protein
LNILKVVRNTNNKGTVVFVLTDGSTSYTAFYFDDSIDVPDAMIMDRLKSYSDEMWQAAQKYFEHDEIIDGAISISTEYEDVYGGGLAPMNSYMVSCKIFVNGEQIIPTIKTAIVELAGKFTTDSLFDNGVDFLPGMSADVKHPPDTSCEVKSGRLREMIIHLNDHHKWTREQIADWLETLDLDLRFESLTNKGETNVDN